MKKKVMIVFPGQGVQYPGMLKNLCGNMEELSWYIQEVKDAVDLDIELLCNSTDKEEMTKTQNAQPAIFFTSFCQYKWLSSRYNIEPAFFAGHSLGEITALSCSGAIPLRDAIKLVIMRGKYMAEMNGQGKMAAVMGAPEKVVNEVCEKLCQGDDVVCIANYNSEEQLTISGYSQGVDKACEILESQGYRCVPLKVSAAFHSKYMQSAAERLLQSLKDMEYHFFDAPVISNVTARPYCDGNQIPDMLYKQLTHGVMWKGIVSYAQKCGVDLIIEVGPGNVLQNLVKQISPSITVLSLGNVSDLERLDQFFTLKENTKNYYYLTERCMAVCVCERNMNFNEEEYEKGVADPYRKLKEMKEKCQEKGSCTKEDAVNAIMTVIEILKNKNTTEERIRARLCQIMRETDTEPEFSHLLLKI